MLRGRIRVNILGLASQKKTGAGLILEVLQAYDEQKAYVLLTWMSIFMG